MTTVETEGTTTLQKGFVGQSIPRKEDKRLVQGEGLFFDDVRRHGMGYVHFVRSPYAHARIVSIDVSAALALEGVYGTITGDEVAIQTDPFFEMSTPPGNAIKDYALAVGKVRHMGEPVAAVCAPPASLPRRGRADRGRVRGAPVLVDGEEALKDETILHDDAARTSSGPACSTGATSTLLAEADHVVKIEKLHFHRFSSTPLECAGALVEYDKGTGEWTLHCNHQMPGIGAIWMGRRCASGSTSCASSLRHRRRLRATRSACIRSTSSSACSRGSSAGRCSGRSGAPTSTPPTRTATSGRSSTSRWRCGRRDDDRLQGARDRRLRRLPRYEPLGCIIWAQVTPGCYTWKNIRVDFTQVCTNKSPVSPNGYSRMQHLWLTERIVDIVAAELGLDPVEVRKRTTSRPRRCRTRRRTAASTTPATTRAASTSRST